MKTGKLTSYPQTGVLSEVLKKALFLLLLSEIFMPVTLFPQDQRSNVQFPRTNQKSIFPSSERHGIIPILGVNDTSQTSGGLISSEFQVGTTGIPCDQPGSFVTAPDGCNRCFCAQNRELSSACSRVFCPPGFPSSSPGQHKL